MPIAKITTTGLTTITLLVLCLWACILGESRIVRHANVRMARTLVELRILRDGRRDIPVSQPRTSGAPQRPSLG